MNWRWLFSQACLLHPTTLWLLTLFYVPGTIYGYFWYGDQLVDTWATHPAWQIVFVPDSPTASLWFLLAMLWLWRSHGHLAPAAGGPGSRRTSAGSWRGLLEALAVVTSVKYGVWASLIIVMGWAQGSAQQWTDWMLIVGHTAMAICALVYARLFTFGWRALAAAAAWTFLNDTVDYRFDVFPWLPRVLLDDLTAVCVITVLLTALSVMSAGLARWLPRAAGRGA